MQTAVKQFGPLGVVVASAGITQDAPLALMPPENFTNVISTNLVGSFNVMRAATPLLMKQRSGSIVVISSVAGVRGQVGQANYSAAKAGQIALAEVAAKELARFEVRVNVVAPGFIETDITEKLSSKVKDTSVKAVGMRRFGQVSEVADAVAYLVSDQATYVTGHTLHVDGGLAF